jgi:hypothetical protein
LRDLECIKQIIPIPDDIISKNGPALSCPTSRKTRAKVMTLPNIPMLINAIGSSLDTEKILRMIRVEVTNPIIDEAVYIQTGSVTPNSPVLPLVPLIVISCPAIEGGYVALKVAQSTIRADIAIININMFMKI